MPVRLSARFLAAVAMVYALSATPAYALLCLPLIGCTCSVAATDMEFDDIQPLSGVPATIASDITVQCSGIVDVAPVVYAGIGPGLHGTIANRRMRSGGGAFLPYNLYDSSLYGTILGEGAGGFPRLMVSGGLLTVGGWSVTTPIYGLAPANPLATPGEYEDTVTVRIEW